MTKPVTLSDVADQAGVSVATASAVARGSVDGPIRVGEDTRRRVEEVIAELGYRPNAAARALKTSRTGMLGLVVPDLTNPLFPQIARAAQLRAERAGLALATWDTDNTAHREHAALEAMLDRQLDGAILVTEFLTVDDLGPAVDGGMLIAATDHRLDAPGVDLVSEDLVAGALGAVNHLLALGHRRIAHLAGERHSTVAAGRLKGYLAALELFGIGRDDDLIIDGPFTRSAGESGARRLLALAEPPTAIFAANDAIAIGALHELADGGVRVPEDVAVVGVDNTPEAAVVRPGLTTMDVHPTEVGEALVDALLGRRESVHRRAPLRRMVTPSLIRRGST